MKWEPWVWRLLVPALLVLLWAQSKRGAEQLREQESEHLQAQGFLVAERDGLKSKVSGLEHSSADLAKELERLRKAAGPLTPVLAASLVTGPVRAEGLPRAPLAPSPGPGSPQVTAPEVATPAKETAPGLPCLLAPGDTGEVRVQEVAVRTEAGNVVMAGTAECWRLSPSPVTRLLHGPFSAGSKLTMEPTKQSLGWGAGLVAGLTGTGWTLGPAVAAPPLKLWSWQAEATAGVGLGPTGWSLGVTLVLR